MTIKWQTLIGAAIVASVSAATFAALQAQQRTASRSSLTPMDYIEIQQLVARYPYQFDGGLRKGAGYADLFTADGAFINQDGRHQGREELERMGGARRQREVPLNVGHYIVNHVIDPVGPGRAKGHEYLLVIDIAEEGPVHGPRTGSIRLAGQYRDEYEKTPQGWRFKTRQYLNKDTSETAEATAGNLRDQLYTPGTGPGRRGR